MSSLLFHFIQLLCCHILPLINYNHSYLYSVFALIIIITYTLSTVLECKPFVYKKIALCIVCIKNNWRKYNQCPIMFVRIFFIHSALSFFQPKQDQYKKCNAYNASSNKDPLKDEWTAQWNKVTKLRQKRIMVRH